MPPRPRIFQADVDRLAAKGWTNTKIASRLGCSRVWVWKMRGGGGGPSSPPWLPENEAILIRMWEKGHSHAQIAKVLNTTRNAVGGKVDRLKRAGVLTRGVPSKAALALAAFDPIVARAIGRTPQKGGEA